jgi:hypothetical protein
MKDKFITAAAALAIGAMTLPSMSASAEDAVKSAC